MPKNGFFFLFMASVTTTAGKGRESGYRGRRRKTTDVPGFSAGRALGPGVTRAPEAKVAGLMKPRPLRIPRADVPESDFRHR